MESNYQFPREGWRFDGSYSYGQGDLYADIPHVVVKEFLESERGLAQHTHQFLKDNGLSTASMDEVIHADGKLHFYVFAERQEFLSAREKLFPDLRISPTTPRSTTSPTNWLALEARLAMEGIRKVLGRLRQWFV